MVRLTHSHLNSLSVFCFCFTTEYAKKLRNRATRTASQLLEKAKKMKSMKARITRNQSGDEASQADIAVRDLDEIGASMDTASHTPTHVEVADGTYQTCDNSMQIEDRNVKGSARKGDTAQLLIPFNHPLICPCSHSQEAPTANTITTSKS